jgi:4-hydroxy-tetrahydrodipicolinate reductase
VVFGSRGETLKIINDPVNRECYMPGVVLACKKIGLLQGLIYGLDQIL